VSIRNRLARLEAGAPDPLADSQRFEVRRLAAEAAVRRNIEAANLVRKMYFPDGPLGEPLDTRIRIENMRDLVAVERSLEENERGAAIVRGLIANGVLEDAETFLKGLGIDIGRV
jgi:hypothetical protein